MAVTKLMNIKESSKGKGRHLFNSIRYIMNPEKTENGLWVGGNSGNECHEVFDNFITTKMDWDKMDRRQGYHFVLSWKPGETDAQTAYDIMKEFCEEYLGENYDYVFSVHVDQEHIHGHIVFNSVNRTNGYKYRYIKGDWEKYIQPVTDKICKRHGLQPLEYDRDDRKGKSYAERYAEKNGKMNNKRIIQSDIDYAISCSISFQDFLDQMKLLGYNLRFGASAKKGRYISFKGPGMNAKRSYQLDSGYSPENIRYRIEHKEKMQSACSKMPKVRRCVMSAWNGKQTNLSRYQVRKVRDLYRTSFYYIQNNPYAVDARKVRKNLLQIEKLQEDCRYLLREGIRSSEELKKREEELKKEEQILKSMQGNLYSQSNEEDYQKYLHIQQKLLTIKTEDDYFEDLQDQLEELEKKLPSNFERTEQDLNETKEKMAAIRQEKRIIRHIKKMDAMDNKKINLHIDMGKRQASKKEINKKVDKAEKRKEIDAWLKK